ncbi:MAG: hypothetical protein ABL903_08105 [Methylococcales bacterium]
MKLLNYKLLLLLITLMASAATPLPGFAEVPGKTKNATTAEVKQALLNTIKATEDALKALKSGADPETVQQHISDARQAVKGVEINRLDVIRTRTSEKLKHARQALNKDEKSKTEELLTESLKNFQEMLRSFESGI